MRLVLLAANDDRHAFAEAFRSLRSSIIFLPVEGTPPKVLLITSAVPNEGKSTVAMNFAITLALSGLRVLLVDGDLRRGEIHRTFSLSNDLGLSDVLGGDCPLHSTVQATRIPGLSLLSRGSSVSNPGELYLSKEADRLLKNAYASYDYVVLDSSPIMAADDTTSLAPKADATLFVFRFTSSHIRVSRKALDLLRERQANIIGVVCNDVSEAMQEYYYYRYPSITAPGRRKRCAPGHERRARILRHVRDEPGTAGRRFSRAGTAICPILPSRLLTIKQQSSAETRAPEAATPLVRIRPPRAWEALDLRALWSYRDLLAALAVRDIKLRYRQTLLGVLWVVLQPLLAAGIFAFIFGRVAHLDSAGEPYVLFGYMGLLVWNLFNGSIIKAAGALVTNAPLVSKIFFPRMLLPFSAIVSTLLDFGIGLVVGFVLMLFYGSVPGRRSRRAFLAGLAPYVFGGRRPLLRGPRGRLSRRHPHPARGPSVPAVRQPRGLQHLGDSCRAAALPLQAQSARADDRRLSQRGARARLIGFHSAIYAIAAAIIALAGGLIFFRRMERQFADVI